MKALNVDVGHRGWIHVSVRDMAQTRLNRLAPQETLRILRLLIEEVFGPLARWVAYDGEAPVVTVELAKDNTMTEEATVTRATNHLGDHETRIYETLITWNDFHP